MPGTLGIPHVIGRVALWSAIILQMGVLACSKPGGGGDGGGASAAPGSGLNVTGANGSVVNADIATSYSLNGSCSPEGATVQISGDVSSTSATCAGGSWSKKLDLSSLTDGGHNLKVDVLVGGQSVQSATLVISKDTLPPVLAFNSSVGAAAIDSSTQGAFTVSGTCTETNRDVKISISSSANVAGTLEQTVACTTGGTFSSTLNLSSTVDGYLPLTISQTDPAGNKQSISKTIFKDTQAPILTIVDPVSGAGGKTVNSVNQAAFQISGLCTDSPNVSVQGLPISYTWTSSAGGASGSGAFNCGNDNQFSGNFNFTAAPTGSTVTVNLSFSDVAGNAATTSASFVKNTSVTPIIVNSSGLGASPSLSVAPRTVSISNPASLTGSDAITSYKGIVIVNGACGSAANQAAFDSAVETPVATGFTFTPTSNAANRACFLGKTVGGAWQPLSEATSTAVLVIDTAAPTAQILSSTMGASPSSDTAPRKLKIGGNDVNYYRAIVMTSGTCGDATNSASLLAAPETSIATEFSFVPLDATTSQVCVIGRDSAGTYQSASAATVSSSLRIDTSILGTPLIDVGGLGKLVSNSIAPRILKVSGTGLIGYKAAVIMSGECADVDFGAFPSAALATPFTITPSANSSTVVCFITQDSSGVWQTAANAAGTPALLVDTLPPGSADLVASTGWNTPSTSPSTLPRTITFSSGTLLVGASPIESYRATVITSGTCTNASTTAALAGAPESSLATPFTFSPQSSSVNTICALAKDAAGNWMTTAKTVGSLIIDSNPPVITIGAASATNVNATSSASFPLTISGATVVNLTTATTATYVTTQVLTGTPSCSMAVSGTGLAARTLTLSNCTGLGTFTISLLAGAAQNTLGSDSSAVGPSATITVDAVVPTVTLTTAASSPVFGMFSVTATFSKSVTGLVSGAFTLGNSSLSAFAGSGTTYTFNVTPLADGPVTVDLAANAAQDSAGNSNSAATQLSLSALVSTPTVLISAMTPAGSLSNATTTRAVTMSGTGITHYKAVVIRSGSCGAADFSAAVETAIATSFSMPITTDGEYTICAIGRNAGGTYQLAMVSTSSPTLSIDTTPPVSGDIIATTAWNTPSPSSSLAVRSVSFSGPAASTGVSLIDTYKATVITSGVCTDGAATSALSAAATTSISTAFSFTPTNSATNVVCMLAHDAAGNWMSSAKTVGSLAVSTSGPVVTIGAASSSLVNSTGTTSFPISISGASTVNLSNATVGTYVTVNTASGSATCTAAVTGAGLSARSVNLTGCTGNGTVTISLAANVAQDSLANASAAVGPSASFAVDNVVPTVTLSTAAGSVVNAAYLVTATFSKSVTGLSIGSFVVGNGTASGLAGSGTTYTLTVTPTTDGSITVDLSSGAAQDGAGNLSSAAAQLAGTTADMTAPTASISSFTPATNPSNSTASRSVNIGGAGVTHYKAVTIRSGACSTADYSSSTETVVATPFSIPISTDGNYTVCAIGRDLAGNYQLVASSTSSATLVVDTASPIAADLSATTAWNTPSASASLALRTITFSGPAASTGVTLLDTYKAVVITSGVCTDAAATTALSGATATPIATNFTFTPSNNVTSTVCALARDTAGNWMATAKTVGSLTTSTTAPIVAIGVPSSTSVNSSGSTAFTISISGATVVNLSGATVGTYVMQNVVSGSPSCTAAVTGAGLSSRTVTLSSCSGNGTLSISLAAGVAEDAGATQSAAVGPSATVTIDNVVPTVTLSTAAVAPVNSAFSVTATFSESVTGFAVGKIAASANASLSSFAGSGTTYTFLVTPIADGAVTLDVASSGGQDGAGNISSAATQLSINADISAPTATISAFAPATNPSNSTTTRTVNVGGAGVTAYKATVIRSGSCGAADFSSAVETAVATSFSVPITTDGDYTVCVIGRDLAGNYQLGAVSTASVTLMIDTATPIAVDVSATTAWNATNPSNSTALRSITFSGPAASTGVTLLDTYKSVVITSGACTDAAATTALSGASVTSIATPFTFTPTANATSTVCVLAHDSAGNWMATAKTIGSLVIDTAAPTVIITSTAASTTNASPIPITVTFNESVTGFTSTSPTIGNGTLSGFAGSGTTYTFSVTPSGQGAVTVNVAANQAQDASGNNNSAASQLTRTYDTALPTVTITSTAPSNTNVSPIPVTVTFSESVTGFTSTSPTIGNGTISGFAGSGTTYTFSVTPSGQGAVTVNVGANQAQDASGNSNSAATQLTRTYDNVVPTVTITSTAASTTNVSPIPITVTFSESVTGFTSTSPTVGNGTVNSFSGSGATYTFTVTPSAGGAVTVDIASAVATDASGNTNSAAIQLSRTSDLTVPTVSISGAPAAADIKAAMNLTATFSESVTGFTSGGITVSNASVSGFSGSGTTYSFTVTPTSQGAVTVDIGAGAAQDAATNGNTAATQISKYYDTTAPAAPTGFTDGLAMSSLSVSPTLNWTAATDNRTISHYQVAIGTTAGGTDVLNYSTSGSSNVGNVTSASVSGLSLTNGTIYYASIKSVDVAGNVSSVVQGDGWRADTSAPNAPTSFANGMAYSSTSQTPSMTWVAPSDPGSSGINHYEIAIGTSSGGTQVMNYSSSGSSNVGNVTAAQITGLSLTNGTTYYTSIKAVDNAGNVSAAATTTAWVADSIAPTNPGSFTDGTYLNSLTATPTLGWAASTDTGGSGVNHYQIAIGTTAGGTNILNFSSSGSSNVGNVTSAAITGLSLTTNTTYYASIKAIDNAGNVSSVVQGDGWIADTTSPTTPGSVTDGTSTSDLTSTPALSWSASTDTSGSGINHYEVAIGTTAGGTDVLNYSSSGSSNVGSGTSATVTGLSLTSGTTYYVSLRAVDNAGNTSSVGQGDGFTASASCAFGKQVFMFKGTTGGDQTFTVPSGCTSVVLQAWGANGGSGHSNGNPSGTGGVGGYATGTLSGLTGGQTLTVVVGKAGWNASKTANNSYGQYGGGAPGGNSALNTSNGNGGGQGGGYAGVFNGTVSLANAKIVAGGGGGAAYDAGGGAGGGTTGNAAGTQSYGAGQGGTQAGGGAGGAGGVGGGCSGAGGAGNSLTGGGGGGGSATCANGGGGGGGYRGGGGGGNYTSGHAGGGGGSSYITGLTNAFTVTGGGNTGVDYLSSSALNNGLVVIRWGDDPFADLVVLGMDMDGADAATIASDRAGHNAATFTGAGVQLTTTSPKFGTASLTVPNGGSKYANIPASTDFDQTGDFTLEAWIKIPAVGTSNAVTATIIGQNVSSSNAWRIRNYAGVCKNEFYDRVANAAVVTGSGATSLCDNAWHHVAIVNYQGTYYSYVDGVQDGSGGALASQPFETTKALRIGAQNTTNGNQTIYIDDLRFTKFARYIEASFTAPTKANPVKGVCPTNYVYVDSLTGYAATDFCVSRYEMKSQTSAGVAVAGTTTYSSANVAASRPNSDPWVNIRQSQAATECAALDTTSLARYKLISNAQWQTVARAVADEPRNWSTGTVNSGRLPVGSTNNLQSGGLDTGLDEVNYMCYGTSTCNNVNTWDVGRRTNFLPNGQFVWDLSGNVAEWILETAVGSPGSAGFASSFSGGDARQSSFSNDAFCAAPGASPYCGFGYGSTGGAGTAVNRGGAFDSIADYSGIFASDFSGIATTISPNIGFRCVFVP